MGYNLNAVVITFVVSGGEISSVTNPAGSSLVAASLTNGIPSYDTGADGIKTYHFVFENTSGAELPSTGEKFGLSRNGFGIAGLVFVGAFAALYLYRKRRWVK